MAIYSHSKLSTFEQCILKYKFRYIDKIKPLIETTIEAHLGKSVHDTLEWLYNTIKQNNKIPTIDETITYYSNKWQDEFSDAILIVKKHLNAKDYFNKGVQFLINYYVKHQPFKDGTIECEKRIILNLDDKGKYKIQGYIDRLVHNLKENQYEIHDYKTANSLPSREKIENDRQLALYSIAIKELVGWNKNIVLIWHYLAHNQKITSQRTNEQLERLKQEIIELINEIESTTNFPSSKSILCNWCEFKPMCPEFAQQKQIQNFEKSEVKEGELDIW